MIPVKHPTIPREELNGKNLAWCTGGAVGKCRLTVEGPCNSTTYALKIHEPRADPNTGPGHKGLLVDLGLEGKFLDQATVEQIVVVPPSSQLAQMGYAFAWIDKQDQQSKKLLHSSMPG